MLSAKMVLLGVTGGIAAYKSAELARLLVKEGFSVQVVMTRAAAEFVSPLTFKSLTGRPVFTSLFDPSYSTGTVHIDLARDPHLVIIAPATANILGKMVAGIADDLLSTILVAVDAKTTPVILAPSMNTAMLDNPAVRRNIELLRERGYIIADPADGSLACGEIGKGRMVEPGQLLELIKARLAIKMDYQGVTVLVTAGPTREALDPVRFISNHSSGKMGYALAQAARERGARVILISGPTALQPPVGVDFFQVSSAQDMYRMVMEKLELSDVVIKAAAVADYRPEEFYRQKIKKNSNEMVIRLVRNPDILKEIGSRKGKRFLVGFAAETEAILENALKKMKEKNLDLIVANDLTLEGAGFASETNIAQLVYRDGKVERLPLMTKYELAHIILDRIKELRQEGVL